MCLGKGVVSHKGPVQYCIQIIILGQISEFCSSECYPFFASSSVALRFSRYIIFVVLRARDCTASPLLEVGTPARTSLRFFSFSNEVMSTKREWDRGKEWSGHKTERRCDEDILANDSSNWKRKRPDVSAFVEQPTVCLSDWTKSTAGLWSGGDIGKDPETAEGYSARSNKRKKHIASEPSPHVIFLGLDLDFTEKDVSCAF